MNIYRNLYKLYKEQCLNYKVEMLFSSNKVVIL